MLIAPVVNFLVESSCLNAIAMIDLVSWPAHMTWKIRHLVDTLSAALFFSSSLCMCLKYETAREGVRHVTLVSEAWERKQNSRRPSSSRRSVQQVLRWMFSKRHLPPRINRTQLIFFCVLAGSWGQSVPQEIKLGKEKENICAAANVWHGAKLCAVSRSLSLPTYK